MNKEITKQIKANLVSWQFGLSRIITNFFIMVGVEWFFYRMGGVTDLRTAPEFLLGLAIHTFISFLISSFFIMLFHDRQPK